MPNARGLPPTGRPPLGRARELVIDETGVGQPVGDRFDAIGGRRWRVAKGLLILQLPDCIGRTHRLLR
jgi:hypothetical protein